MPSEEPSVYHMSNVRANENGSVTYYYKEGFCVNTLTPSTDIKKLRDQLLARDSNPD